MSYYVINEKYTSKQKKDAWYTAIGLQDVDNIKVSDELYSLSEKNINNEIQMNEVESRIYTYYEIKKDMSTRTEEADKVSINITKLILNEGFTFSVAQYLKIHEMLFKGIYSDAGKIRNKNIGKKEWILNGASVKYANYEEIEQLLNYDFKIEKEFNYKGLNVDEILHHISRFIANIWQIHVFSEGNTRTTTVFLIKYLKYLGFKIDNTIFKNNSWYFRNTLVIANYNDLQNGIYENIEPLENFLRNIILNEKNEMSNEKLKLGR